MKYEVLTAGDVAKLRDTSVKTTYLQNRRLPGRRMFGAASAGETGFFLGVTSTLSTNANGINPRTLGAVAVWKYSLSDVGPPPVVSQTSSDTWYYWGSGDIPAFSPVIGMFLPEIDQTVIIEVYQADRVTGRFSWYKLANPLSVGNDPLLEWQRVFLTRRSFSNDTTAYPDTESSAAQMWGILSAEGEFPDLSPGSVSHGLATSTNDVVWVPDYSGGMSRWNAELQEFSFHHGNHFTGTLPQYSGAGIDRIVQCNNDWCLVMGGTADDAWSLFDASGFVTEWTVGNRPGDAGHDSANLTYLQHLAHEPVGSWWTGRSIRDYGQGSGWRLETNITNLTYFDPGGGQSGARFDYSMRWVFVRGTIADMQNIPWAFTQWSTIFTTDFYSGQWEILLDGNNVQPEQQYIDDHMREQILFGTPSAGAPTWPYTTNSINIISGQYLDATNAGGGMWLGQPGTSMWDGYMSNLAGNANATPSIHYEVGNPGGVYAANISWSVTEVDGFTTEKYKAFVANGTVMYEVSSLDWDSTEPSSLLPGGVVADMKGGGGWIGCLYTIQETQPVAANKYAYRKSDDASNLFTSDHINVWDYRARWSAGYKVYNPNDHATRPPLRSCSDYHFFVGWFDITDATRISELTGGNYTQDDFLAGESHTQNCWILPNSGGAATPCIDGASPSLTENIFHRGTTGDTNKRPGEGTPPAEGFMPDQPFGVKPES